MKKLFVAAFSLFACAVACSAAMIPDAEIAKVFGNIKIVYSLREHYDYRVLIVESLIPDLIVERVDSELFAREPGLWHILSSNDFETENFTICIVGPDDFYDFTIRFARQGEYPGLPYPIQN